MQTSKPSTKAIPHIVVVGGGAGGLELATKLGHKLGRKHKANITLIDQHRVHIWKPLLHEVATGSLDTEIDGIVYRAHAARHGYHFLLGSVSNVDRDLKSLTIDALLDDQGETVVEARTVSYDTLVLAIGSVSNDFGTPGVMQHCSMLDSKQQAQRFQQNLLNLLLKKSQSGSNNEAPSALKLAIVGAGATGVELSAELYHVIEVVSMYDMEGTVLPKLNIDLIEAGPRILPALPERIADSATQELKKLGVCVHTNTRITDASPAGFTDANQTLIAADIMVWAAGVRASNWLADIGLEVNRINQIVCQATLKTQADPDIYAIGDCCAITNADGSSVPPRAQAAHQMATTVARNIIRELSGKPLSNFKYVDYGSLVNLSRFSTVGSLMGNLMRGSLFIEGRIARLMYLSLYRMHQLAVHGYIKGPFIILLSSLSKIIRPKIKLH